MAIKSNVVTVSASSAISKSQRVTLCGADSITLTLPVFDDIDITSNTRFVVLVPAGSGFSSIQMATPDGLLFDANGLTTYTLPSEGQFEFCVNNSRWYCQYVTSTGSGGGSPGAPVNSMQYNNSGIFGGSTVNWDSVNNQFELTTPGTNVQPTLMFGNSMGFYQVGTTTLGLSISNVLRLQCDATDLRSGITGGFRCLHSSGSASNAVISPNNDTNTGIWWQAADQMNFTVGGTDRMTFNTTNISGPASTYLIRSVAGSATTPTYSFPGSTGAGFYSDAANTIKFSTTATQRGTIDSSGRVFLGGSTAPTARLHLGAGTATANTAPFKTTTGTLNATAESGAWEHSEPYIYFTNSFLIRNKIPLVQSFLLSPSFTKTADITQSVVTGLSASVAANNNYHFFATLHIDADAVGGFDIGFNGTTTITGIIIEYTYFDNAGTSNFSRRVSTFPGSFGGVAGTTEGCMKIEGYFRANLTGTFEITFGQQVAAGSSTVLTRSTLQVYQG